MAEESSVLVDVHDMPLNQWLELLFDPPKSALFVDYEFPTAEHLREYVETIDQRPQSEVYRLLLKLLIPSGSLKADERHLETLLAIRGQGPGPVQSRALSQYDRRLTSYFSGRSRVPPWEGITWVLDLLPYSPGQAIDVLMAYVLVHAQELPDGRYAGLHDAATVIRAKFIGMPGTQSERVQSLLDGSPRDFEHLVERLFDRMGYRTELTPAQKDGGRDVVAAKQAPGMAEQVRVECKRHSSPVGVENVRALLGVVSDERVNKGVLVTTGRFTGPAHKFANRNPRLELINGDRLVRLMNEHMGTTWPMRVDRLITQSQLKDRRAHNS